MDTSTLSAIEGLLSVSKFEANYLLQFLTNIASKVFSLFQQCMILLDTPVESIVVNFSCKICGSFLTI